MVKIGPNYDLGVAFPRKHLNDDEHLVVDLHPHWIFLAPSVVALIAAVAIGIAVLTLTDGTTENVLRIIAGLLVLAALVWFGVRYAKWLTTEFAVSNHRVMSRWGVLSKHGRQIPLERINTVEFSQSLFERMLGAGDLGIESASDGGREEFTDIRHPDEVQREIYIQIRANVDRPAAGGAPAMPTTAGSESGSVADQLTKLDELRRNGVLSEAEFQAQKARLLQA